MYTPLLIVAGIAGAIAIVLFIRSLMGSPSQSNQVPSIKPVGAPPPMPPGQLRAPRAPRHNPRNKRGWRAPVGHYFDDNDDLFADAGDAILDIILVAQLCGESYDPTEEAAIESAPPIESCCDAPEVTSHSDFGDLQTGDVTPSYSAPDTSYGGSSPSDYGAGGGYDSGDCDSGGGDCGGGSDDD